MQTEYNKLIPLKHLFIIAVFFIYYPALVLAQNTGSTAVWISDQGNGTYRNPILYADYSDPDAIRVGNDYYMVSSSFNCVPGLPILHSKDLVNWRVINYALKKLEPEDVFDSPQQGKGVWAPCIRYHDKFFYIFYPDPDYGIYMTKAANPSGEWSKPVLVLKGKGIIDPTPLWDEDGKAYLAIAWAASRAGVNSLITLFRMDPEGTKVIDGGRHIYDGHEQNPTIEGPKFYKRHGFYYIFAPAGGVVNGWQVVLRAKNIYGPYEAKVVMDQGKTKVNGPHQGAYIETQNGQPWFIHFRDRGAYGRVIYLEPVKWINNWPIIGFDPTGDGKGEPVLTYKKPAVGKPYAIIIPASSDEFSDGKIGYQWQWQANPMLQWSALLPNSGFLRLFAITRPQGTNNLWRVPNLLLQKLPAPTFSATTKLSLVSDNDEKNGKMAGLIMMGNDYAYLTISKDGKGYAVNQVTCKDAPSGTNENLMASKHIENNTVFLRVNVKGDNAECQFSYSEDGKNYQNIGESFLAKPVKWTGAKVGIFCTAKPDTQAGGYADFDWFRISK